MASAMPVTNREVAAGNEFLLYHTSVSSFSQIAMTSADAAENVVLILPRTTK
jgi:hypothetical protein